LIRDGSRIFEDAHIVILPSVLLPPFLLL